MSTNSLALNQPPNESVNWSQFAIPVSILAVVLAMITPLPAFLLDALISLNIALSVVVLLVSIYIRKPAEFSLFPTLLLILTLFRLALNVSSSRLILLNGNTGTAAAGHVIEAFGNFVVGGNYFVGTVIFLVLIAIQYVVINHGAVRISEVTARFTLDALPGKQMSIDADLNNGLIDEAEAKKRRAELSGEAEFYGSMDGASRFTQRDAVASIIITAINILAGILIGVLQQNMEILKALQTYAILTIGDGLVTVIPALLISVTGGLIVTRASAANDLSTQIQSQIFDRWQPLAVGGGVIVLLAFFPGLPAIPFLSLGGTALYIGFQIKAKEEQVLSTPPPPPLKPKRDELEAALKVDLVAVEVGIGLVKLLEGGANSPLLRKISSLRKQLATETGFILPPVRVTDSLGLKPREYLITLRGIEADRFEVLPGHELALESGTPLRRIDGISAKDPAFGLPAIWVAAERSDEARKAGYTVVDPLSLLVTHFGELMRRQAHELFTRQDAKKMLDRVSEENTKVVEDLGKVLSLSTFQKVLQNLLRERVSIRDGLSIVESLSEAANISKNPVLLTEFVRQALRRVVVKPYLNASGALPIYFLDPVWEKRLESAVEHGELVSQFSLGPQEIRDLLNRTQDTIGTADVPVVVLTTSTIRFFLRQIFETQFGNVHAISHSEVPPGTKLVSLGQIR
jgi:flagellar biosynthesis protein FlhA